ncbi:MAG: hypothetical protein ACOC3V_01240 [bacterium]
MKKSEIIQNRLSSELWNMVAEFKNNTLTEEGIYNFFSIILRDADVDSRIVVNVLERFGDLGKQEALAIKINEGW